MAKTNVRLSTHQQATTIATHEAVATGRTVEMPGLYVTFQATASDNGGDITVGTALIEVSNDGDSWITAGTLNVTTDGTTDGFAANAAWKFVRSRCTVLTETGSTPRMIVTMGV